MITIVYCDTGFDKIISIPHYLSKNKYIKGNIFCSLPATTTTISAYNYQSQLCDNYGKNIVGYAHDHSINYNYHTKIVYCTTTHLVDKLLRTVSNISKETRQFYKPWFCSVLILDEFHSRTKESDICLCLWISAYNAWKENPNLPKPPKLVIMSAILNDNMTELLPTKPSIFSYGSMDPYPITTVYDYESKLFQTDSENRYIRAADLACDYHLDNYNGTSFDDAAASSKRSSPTRGTYLIFVPGKQEIDFVARILKRKLGNDVVISSVYDGLLFNNLIKLYEPVLDKRNIIIATNIMEYSIVIENISLVIDTLTYQKTTFGLDKNIRTNLQWISKSRSNQRKNRTGKTCAGIYIIMQSEEVFSRLAEDILPEIEHFSVGYDILRMMKFGLDPITIFSPIMPIHKIETYVGHFKNLGFIDTPTNRINDISNFCPEFPLSIRKSAMLYHLSQSHDPCIFLHLAVICTLDCYGNGLFIWPKKNTNEDSFSYIIRSDDVMQKFEDNFAGYSDVDTIFNIWIMICEQINPFYITDLKNFCRKNQLNFGRLKDAVYLLKQCIHVCNKIGFHIYPTKINPATGHTTHDFGKIIPPNKKILGMTFYNLLTLTHQDYAVTISYNLRKEPIANYDGVIHKIDNKSIHLMNTGDNIGKIYYALIRSQRTTEKGIIKIINVLHGISSNDEIEDDDDNRSIFFSSDAESDTESIT